MVHRTGDGTWGHPLTFDGIMCSNVLPSMTESAAEMALILQVESGPCAGATTLLEGGQALLGRDTDSTLCLAQDTTVSRRHASLSREGRAWILRDLGSKNGVFLGGERLLAPRIVAPGDVFSVGSARIGVLRYEPPSASPCELRIGLTGAELQLSLESGAALVPAARIPWRETVVVALQRARLALLSTEQGGGQAAEREFLNLGADLADLLLPPTFQEAINALEAGRALQLVLDPALIGLAWESLTLAGVPWCMARPLARRVLLDAPASVRAAASSSEILIVANPTGDLPEAQREGEALYALLEERAEARFLAGRRAAQRSVASAMERCGVALYLGHAEHDPAAPRRSGWRLADGMLEADRLGALRTVPALVIAAACESARETPATSGLALLPEGTGIAAGMLLAGVEQYVGTLWRMPTSAGTAFGGQVLQRLIEGRPLGDAMLAARRYLRDTLDTPSYVYSGQVHYGTPGWRLRNVNVSKIS